MELNVKTLYLVGAVVTMCAAGASLLTWYHHRNAPGLRGWATALLMTSAGALVLRLQTSPPDMWIILAANAVIVAGFAVMWMSLRLFNQARFDPVRLLAVSAGVSVGYVALCGLASAVGAGQQTASIPFSLFLGGLSVASAHEIWQGRKDGVRSRLPTALALVGLGLARLIRAATLSLEVAGVLGPGGAAPVHPYTLYATVVFILAVTYGLVMIANERAARRDEVLFKGG
jgi:hypothetical protein